MCGIAGYFDTREQRPIAEPLLRAMTDAIAHRGPDGSDLFRAPGVGFGHRRLAIIDLACGQQPMATADGQVVIVFNGEIYNFQDVRRELEAYGHRFRTSSDTEVILHAWLEYGEACVHRLRGMFAFAIFDARTRTLFMARDRLGVKPLHYSLLPSGELIFGSELKALLPHPQLARTLDPTAIEDYFAYGYVPDPKSVLAGVSKLPAGHTLTLRQGRPVPAPVRYWDVDFTTRHRGKAADLAAELTDRMREAVKLRMIADVPLGAFLSGGVDSSAVVAMMAQQDDKPVQTCSIGFDHPDYDESIYANEVATRYRTNHFSQIVDKDDYGLVDTLARLYDEPFADSSAIPTYRVCQLARQRVTVALSGDGGDENFAGYRRYRFAMAEQRVRDKLPLGLRKPVFGTLGRLYPKADWAPRVLRAKTTFEALARDTVEGYFHGVSRMPDRMRDELFSEGFKRRLQGYSAIEVFREHAAKAPTEDPLSLIQYLDFKTWLPGDILTKVDRASMAHSLEVRVPLLDHTFVEWASSLPTDIKLGGGEGKYILKKSLEPFLSHDVLYRAKQGFSIPLAAWLRGPLRDKLRAAVRSPQLLDTGIFNADFLHTMAEQHIAGTKDHSAALWQVLMFETFLRVNAAA
jgi:asparagine synthase (glutamine-hydrolysing)